MVCTIPQFYAGKIGMGILYVLFCWTGIPALIAFIEFIIGPGQLAALLETSLPHSGQVIKAI